MTPLLPMHSLGHGFIPPSIHSGGLRYHGMAPLVSLLLELGLIEASAYPQNACFEAGVLVRFTGTLQPGVTLRDVVNAIPYVAIQQGLLTVEKAGKKNIFSGRIMEIEGLPDLKLEQAFELTDATAERSCAGSTIKLSVETVSEYLRSNVADIIQRGGFPPVHMSEINFQAMYEQQQAQQAAAPAQ